MKKTKLVPFLLLILLLFLVSPHVSIVQGFSQTFEVPQGVYFGIASFNLIVGDQIEGSFSVSNLGPYQRLFGNGTAHIVVEVWIIDPSGHPPASANAKGTILYFSATPSENSFNFNFTAHEQGTYQMWGFSGATDYIKNGQNPVMTLSYEWTGTPMEVNILSPSNQTYTKANVSLSFTINRPCDWAAYSLDGANNVTLWDSHNGNPETANTTLTGLSNGLHNITVYAEDSFGNESASEAIVFNVEVPEPFPTLPVAVSAATIALVSVSLLVYFKKRKR